MISESELLLKMLSFDTQNSKNFNEIKSTDSALDFLADLLTKEGFSISFQDYEIGNEENKINRRNLIATIEGHKDKPSIGFQGHIDTIAFGSYKGNPLGEKLGEKICGRGAVDMKGPVSGMISALIQSKKENKISVNPYLIITSDEEANIFAGIERFLQNPEKLDLVINGEPSNFIIENKYKGALYGIITVKGISGHGSRQYLGINAIVKGSKVLEELVKMYQKAPSIVNEKFISENSHSHESSMNIGLIKGGIQVNTIPDLMKIEFEMRLVNPSKQYLDWIEESLSPYRGSSFDNLEYKFVKDPISVEIDKENPFYDKINSLGEKWGVAIGLSEANMLNRAGIPTITYGVGDISMPHSEIEFIRESDLKKYIEKLKSLLQ